MDFWKIISALFIAAGVLFFIFLKMVSDPEIEGEAERISLGEYALSLVPIALGIFILVLQRNNRKSE